MPPSSEVCLYVCTTRSDYVLAKALVASLRVHAPSSRIIVLPDDDYPNATMFGCEVWKPEDPRVRSLDRFYKKLRIFWGPAERFVFFDADQLVVRPLRPWLELVARMPSPFFAANQSRRVHGEWTSGGDAARERIFRERVGRRDEIARFDPEIGWMANFAFNSGEFAASRDAVDQAEILETFERAREHHARHSADDPLEGSRNALFMGDQGFLNYYMGRFRPHVAIRWVPDLHLWGGHAEAREQPAGASTDMEGSIIHWAGCPRPGPRPLEPWIPRHAAWQRAYLRQCLESGDYAGAIEDSFRQVVHVARRWGSGLKRLLRGRT